MSIFRKKKKNMRVIVVGAGGAGLTATHELRKKGFDVVTLEKEDRPGGRIYCLREDGYVIDAGAQFLSIDYVETVNLCWEIGLGEDLLQVPIHGKIWANGNFYHVGLVPDPIIFFNSIRYFYESYSVGALLGFARLVFFTLRRWFDCGYRSHNLWDLENWSFADLIMQICGREALELLLEPVLCSLALAEPENIGAITATAMMHSGIINIITGLYTLKKGMGSITERLYEMYGDCIRLSTPARRIVIENNVVRGVETDDGFLEADAVICCTTASQALDLMPDLPQPLKEALGKAFYGFSYHVIFAVDRSPFSEGEFGVVFPRKSGSPVAAIMSARAKSVDLVPEGDLLQCFIYGKKALELAHLPEEEIGNIAIEVARQYIPGMPDRVRFLKVIRFDESVSTGPRGALGELFKAGRECSGYVKGLYLAGDAYDWGGVETAVITAKETVDYLYRENYG